MTPAFTARRRAEEFDALVEALSTGALRDADHDAPSRDSRYADLLEVVGALRAAPPPTPRPEFVADLRSRLMTAAETALVAPAAPTPVRAAARTAERSRRRDRRLAAAIGGFAIVSATTSMAVAAQSALPGDTLYPLKRGLENAQVRVQSGDEDKGTALLENAAGRLAEVDELSRDGEGSASDISATLDDFSAQATEASELLLDDYAESGRVASLEDLRSFAADSLGDLEGLEGLIPAEARGALLDAARTITRIDELAREACPACTDGPAAISPLLTAGGGGGLPALDDQAPAAPARAERPGGGRSGDGRGGATPTPAPDDPDPTGPEPTDPPPSQPSLPSGSGGDRPQPPATGAGAENPLEGVIDGLTGRGGSGGSGSGAGGTGGGGGTGGTGGNGTGRTTGGGGLDDVVEGLGDLLGGGS